MVKALLPGKRKGLDLDFELDETAALEAYTFADKVFDRLKDVVGNGPSKPRIVAEHEPILSGLKTGDYFDGRLPVVIKNMTLDQLSALSSLFASWYAYLTYQIYKVAVEVSEARAHKESIWAMIRQQKKIDEDGNKRDPTSMSNAASNDARFIKANARFLMLSGLHECLEAMGKIADKDMKTVSRQLTFLQTKIEQDGVRGHIKARFTPKFSQGDDNDAEVPTPKQFKSPTRTRHIIKRTK